METCKAIIQEGLRKGQKCKFPQSKDNLYCGRHQRNYEYELLINSGKLPCRFFFRGCDNLLKNNNNITCEQCRIKLLKKQNYCDHPNCKFKTNEKYCKKHERDKFYDEEIEKNIKYCDIERGCFNICENNLKTCKDCLENLKKNDRIKRKIKNKMNEALVNNTLINKNICVQCAHEFEKFDTKFNKPSRKCLSCNEKQKLQDFKRLDRGRNYKHEKLNNIQSHYKQYITSANKRKYEFKLNFDEFKNIVTKPCHYCDYYKETEVCGIDRVDNSKGYTIENSVSCCEICNKMKLYYHPKFFIEKCKIISKNIIPSIDYYRNWKIYYGRSITKSYISYKNMSEKQRNLSFHITEDEYNKLICESCYLCGYQSFIGIGLDRVDNTKREYRIENVKACCGSCNLMKSDIPLDELIEKAQYISNKWEDTSCFDEIKVNNNYLKKAEEKMKWVSPNPTERKCWKANGVYYSIMTNSDEFYESNKDIYSFEEFKSLKNIVMSSSLENCKDIIKKLLVNLKKRRHRTKIENT